MAKWEFVQAEQPITYVTEESAPLTIEPYQQGNPFALTLRGHSTIIPYPEEYVLKEDYNPDVYINASLSYSEQVIELAGESNFNPIYDSFFAPVDCKLKAITLRLLKPLPETNEYKVSIKLNGGEIELLPVPRNQDHNQLTYGVECDLHIWEDDFIEITVDVGGIGDYERLSFPNHNMVTAISGCIVYDEYKDIFPGGTIPWEEGDEFFKTNLTLQNRSGNNDITDRIFMDVVRSPITFLIQGIRLSMFEDRLITVDLYERVSGCFFLDILVNGKSVNRALQIDAPAAIDTLDNSLKSYNSGSYDNKNGYPVRIGDDVILKIYQLNRTAKYNGKIAECILFGCSSDCVNLATQAISVYELCSTEPCIAKFTVEQNCDPNKLLTAPNKTNPIIDIEPSPFEQRTGEDIDTLGYVVRRGDYVIINGKRIYIRR